MKRTVQAGGKAAAEVATQADRAVNVPLLNKKLEQILQSRRDAILETGAESRRYHEYLNSLLPEQPGIASLQTLIIVPTVAEVREIEDYSRILSRKSREESRLAAVGAALSPRQEARLLAGNPDILAGTPERIIDHLRRGNMDLSRVGRVIIDCPPEEGIPGFSADVQFIYSRTGFAPHTTVLTEALHDGLSEIKSILNRPKIIEESAWRNRNIRFRYFLSGPGGKDSLFGRIVRSEGGAGESWFAAGIRTRSAADSSNAVRIVTGRLSGLGRGAFLNYRRIVLGYVPSPEEIGRILSFYGDCENPGDVVIIITDREYPSLLDTQEKTTVNMEKGDNPRHESAIGDMIKDLVYKIKHEEDPKVLNGYKKHFTKNVSIFLRSYVAAYLIKQLYEGGGVPAKRRAPVRNTGRQDMMTLFFGLGKNRKVFPRDITGMITGGVPGIDRSDIGEIKILDNYSFVEISEKQAQRVIDALNGVDYRGRKVTINFARKKEGPQTQTGQEISE